MRLAHILSAVILTGPFAFAGSVTEVLEWSEQFMAKNGNVIKGRTSQGLDCEFTVWDKSYKGDSSCGPIDHKQSYISLGTAVEKSDDFTYVGFSINPDCTLQGQYEVKAMEITPMSIHIRILHDEAGEAGKDITNVENDLIINTDMSGKVIQVKGLSSHWPSSICMFE